MEETLTESLVREAILMGLEDVPAGSTPEQTAETILMSIRTALRLEARMGKASDPEPAPSAPKKANGIPTPPPDEGESMILMGDRTPAPKQPAGKPLIVMPGDPEANEPVPSRDETVRFRPALRVSSLKKAPRNLENWKIEDLTAYLHANTPTTLNVVPTGMKSEITLERNIITAAPMGCAKLVYTLHGMSGDRPGQMGQLNDATVVAAVIGRFVFKNFFVTDPLDLEIPKALAELKDNAKDVFKRRNRELQSFTPYKPGGHLRIEVDDRGRVSDPSIPGTTYDMDLTVKE